MARLTAELTLLADWLHTEIDPVHRELNAETVTHPSTNRARRMLTALIETNALPLRQTASVILTRAVLGKQVLSTCLLICPSIRLSVTLVIGVTAQTAKRVIERITSARQLC